MNEFFVALCLVVALNISPVISDYCKMDISFVVDASTSVEKKGFKIGMEFIIELLGHFEISQEATRASVITFSGQNRIHGASDYQPGSIDKDHAVNFAQSSSKEALVSAIRSIPYLQKGYTNTSAGIEYALDHQMSHSRKVERVLVVITDGKSQNPELTAAEGKRARDQHLAVFAVGVGSAVKIEELKAIAGDMSHVFTARTYERLSQEILDDLTNGICIPEKNCRALPVDLMLVVDTSSSINGDCQCDAYSQGLEFLSSVLDVMDVDDGTTRVAAVQYARGVREADAIPFAKYNTKSQLKDAILNLKYYFPDDVNFGTQTRTGEGIDYARTHFLPMTRPGSAKVVIVVTDGHSNYGRKTRAESVTYTLKAADRMRAEGASIISIGVGLTEETQESELVKIADSRNKMLTVDKYDELKGIMDELSKGYCKAALHNLKLHSPMTLEDLPKLGLLKRHADQF